MAKHKKVDPTLAQDCADHYTKIYKGTKDEVILKAYSNSVIFDKVELIAWLNTIPEPSIKVALGVYTPEFAKQYPGTKEGRLTAFLWPCYVPVTTNAVAPAGMAAGGPPFAPTDPLNLGDLTP